MDTQFTAAANNPAYGLNCGRRTLADGAISEEDQEEEEEDDEEEKPSGNGRTTAGGASALAERSPPAATAQSQSSTLAHWAGSTEGECEAASESTNPPSLTSEGLGWSFNIFM